MRKRVDPLGVAQPEIQRTGSDEIDVALPDVSNAGRAEEEVGKTAQLYFYDWEPNVIGPDGKPAPTEGDASPAAPTPALGSTSGLPEYQAVLRAAKRPPIIRKNDTTLSPGARPNRRSTAASTAPGTCSTPSTKRCCAGPRKPKQTSTPKPSKRRRARVKAVRVNPGTVLVQARPVESAAGKVTNPRRTAGTCSTTTRCSPGSDITNPQQSSESDRAHRSDVRLHSHGKTSSSRSPRKSPNVARKPSCRA